MQTIQCGIYNVMKELCVKNIVISKQIEKSEESNLILKLAIEKNINIIIVNEGQKLYIDKYVYFDILWPENGNLIETNGINNNSIIAKMKYKNFTMLFTGDIEEISEKQILNKYNKQELKSTILKIAHHGSKTSSIQEFLEEVSPQIALIGVGKNNTYGHPNLDVLNRLQNLRY